MAKDNVESGFEKAFAAVIQTVRELMDFAGFVEASLDLGGITKQMPQLISEAVKRRSEKIDWLDEVTRRTDEIGRLAESRSDMLGYLYSLCVVRLCSMLDSLIDEVVLVALSDRERWTRMPKLTSLQANKVNLVSLMLSSSEQQAHYLVRQIRESTTANLRVGCGRYEVVLDAVGLSGPIPSPVSAAFLELIETRNAVIHRNGVADQRFLDRCPDHRARLGEKIELDRAAFTVFAYSAIWYIDELGERASRVFSLDPWGSEEFPGRMLKSIEEMNEARKNSTGASDQLN